MGKSSKTPNNTDASLSKALVITRPLYSYALIAFAVAGLVAVLWGVFGSIPQKIEGIGEVTTKDGLHKVNALYGGQVQKVNIQLNDTVKEGDVLFEIRQPEMENDILELKANISLLRSKDSLVKSGNSKSVSIKGQVDRLGVESLRSKKVALEKTITNLEEKVTQQQELYNDGLITYSEYFETQNDLASAKTAKIELDEQLSSLTLNSNEWSLGKNISEADIANQLAILSKKLEDLQKEYDLRSKVLSKSNGVVVQTAADMGDIVSPEVELAVIEDPESYDDYRLNLYIAFSSNEPIKPGMQVDVEPFTVDYNLYGWLKGSVLESSQYVSSSYSILNDVENEDLVKLVESKGPVYKVTVKLETDPKTVSGFAWTNKTGPPYKILPGQLSLGYVHVKEKAPIDYLIPIFKEYFE